MSEEATSTETTAAETTGEETETTLATETTSETTETEVAAETTEGAETTEATTEAEAEAEAKTKEGDEAQGAPEAYEEFTMPEGIELDATISDEFKGVAKELNLSQDQAQKVVDLAAQMRQRDVETIIETRQSWIDETKADKEIGGDKLEATLSVAKRALDAHGSPQFIELLNQSGLGNHPEVVRFMAKVGRTVAEDKVVGGGNGAVPQHHTIAKKLFPGSS
jgi:hypothetical protein